MKLLLQSLRAAKKHTLLLVLSIITLIGLTLASYMEIFSLGLITQNTIDVFSVFGKGKEEKVVTKEHFLQTYQDLDKHNKGYFTEDDVSRYVQQKKSLGIIQKAFLWVRIFFATEKSAFVGSLVLVIFVVIFKSVFLFFSRFFPRILSIKISKEIRELYFAHLQKLSMRYFQNEQMGAISTRVVADAKQIADALNSLVTNYIYLPFTFCSSLIFCLVASWKLTLVFFTGIPLVVIPMILISKKVKKMTHRLMRNQESFTSVLLDFLGGIETIKLFQMENYSYQKFAAENDQIEKLEIRTNCFDLLTRPIVHFITMFSLVSISFIGLYLLHLALSELIVFCGILYALYEPVKKFAEENASLQKGIVAAERLFEVISKKPEIVDAPMAIWLDDFKDKIIFDAVSFSYDKMRVLHNVSFTIQKGERVAIIGKTGSGKSTIFHLLSRLYDVNQGSISIDGINIKQLSLFSLRRLITYVPQKPFLFHDTILNNITLGETPDSNKLQRTLDMAHVSEFLSLEKEQGLVKEGGKNFSGGQGQRISLARAIYKTAPILLFDEATSALDPISERIVGSAVDQLAQDTTQIVITHRLSSVQTMDRFIVLDEGRVVADGRKEDLLQNNAYFIRLWNGAVEN